VFTAGLHDRLTLHHRSGGLALTLTGPFAGAIADRYGGLNPKTYVCRNGIDLKRYALTVPERAAQARRSSPGSSSAARPSAAG
jgi:hypothetical protein